MEKNYAIITGADGGMGQVITLAIARAGYPVIMACKDPDKATPICERIRKESGNEQVEVRQIDLARLSTVIDFAEELHKEGRPVSLLINNAGILTSPVRKTEDGVETLVSVNYLGPHLLGRLLEPLYRQGTRIVNTVSCTYAIGKIKKDFYTKGKNGLLSRIQIYANTKLAMLFETIDMDIMYRGRGATVNAADPGIVSTDMIRMNAWFDPLTDILFRPFIKTPEQGAATAIYLALSPEMEGKSRGCYANCKEKDISKYKSRRDEREKLWDDTDEWMNSRNMYALIHEEKYLPYKFD